MIKKILLILILLIPNITYAEELNINLSCPQYAYPDEVITCNLSYDYVNILNAIILKYKLPKEITIDSLELSNKWLNYLNNNLGLVIYSNSKENKEIAKIKFKISKKIKPNNEYTIELINIDTSDIEYNSYILNNIKTTIKVITKEEKTTNNEIIVPNNNTKEIPNNNTKEIQNQLNKKNNTILNNDSKLKSITLSYGSINFNKDIFTYTITIPNKITNINIEAIPNNEKSKVKIEKPKKLNIGNNTITISVIAEDNSISKYILNIIREESLKETLKKEKSNKVFITIYNIRKILIIITIIIITFIIKKIIKRKI